MKLRTVRRFILELLPALGVHQVGPWCEIPICKDGREVGRAFEFDGLQVVWSEAEQIVEFRDESGTMLDSVILTEDAPLSSELAFADDPFLDDTVLVEDLPGNESPATIPLTWLLQSEFTQ